MQDIFDMSNIEWGLEFSRLTVYNYVDDLVHVTQPYTGTTGDGTTGDDTRKNLPDSERVKNEQ